MPFRDAKGSETRRDLGEVQPDNSIDRTCFLFVSANAEGQPGLSIQSEIAKLRAVFGKHSTQVLFLPYDAIKYGDFVSYVRDHQPAVIHFSGHGTETNEILMQDDDGNVQAVSGDVLRHLLKIPGNASNLQLILLNCCHSLSIAQKLKGHVQCLVAMDWKIDDTAAIKFSVEFYKQLLLGHGKQPLLSIENCRAAFDNSQNILSVDKEDQSYHRVNFVDGSTPKEDFPKTENSSAVNAAIKLSQYDFGKHIALSNTNSYDPTFGSVTTALGKSKSPGWLGSFLTKRAMSICISLLAFVLLTFAVLSVPRFFGSTEYSIAGIVKDADGEAVSDLIVELKSNNEIESHSCLTSENGAFLFDSVAEGDYEVYLNRKGVESKRVENDQTDWQIICPFRLGLQPSDTDSAEISNNLGSHFDVVIWKGNAIDKLESILRQYDSQTMVALARARSKILAAPENLLVQQQLEIDIWKAEKELGKLIETEKREKLNRAKKESQLALSRHLLSYECELIFIEFLLCNKIGSLSSKKAKELSEVLAILPDLQIPGSVDEKNFYNIRTTVKKGLQRNAKNRLERLESHDDCLFRDDLRRNAYLQGEL